jgi:(2Fe-2S) ferredoxin
VVVYPEGVWYGGVKVEDVPAIVDEHLVGGKPVERLLLQTLQAKRKEARSAPEGTGS